LKLRSRAMKANKAASDQAHPFVLTRHNLTVLFRL
jgi:hypothetical protein